MKIFTKRSLVLPVLLVFMVGLYTIPSNDTQGAAQEQEKVVEYEEIIVCERVCSGNGELVQYAWDLTHDMDFILTITQESKRNRKADGMYGEEGLLQWTRDTEEKRLFLDSMEFNNPHRQVDHAWYDRNRSIPYPEVINFQLKLYKHRENRSQYFSFELVPIN